MTTEQDEELCDDLEIVAQTTITRATARIRELSAAVEVMTETAQLFKDQRDSADRLVLRHVVRAEKAEALAQQMAEALRKVTDGWDNAALAQFGVRQALTARETLNGR